MSSEVIMEARNLVKHFPIRLGFFKTMFAKQVPYVHAVDDVSFNIYKNEIFGLVGESGCGKTTTGRLAIKLVDPTAGEVIFKGTNLTAITSEKEMRTLRRQMQIIFQDPYESLNPRMSVFDIIAEPARLQKIAEDEEDLKQRVFQTLEDLDLSPPEEFMFRFPHELSGGQRQRVAIGRAFILRPEFLVADEPVSMLDASIRSEVLKVLIGLIEKYHTSFLYITHDMAMARHMCKRISVMYLGKLAEQGPAEKVIREPLHPYSEALIAAVPIPDPMARRTKVVLKGEVPSAINPPHGCRFHTRCPYAWDLCRKEEPPFAETEKNRFVACHKYKA